MNPSGESAFVLTPATDWATDKPELHLNRWITERRNELTHKDPCMVAVPQDCASPQVRDAQALAGSLGRTADTRGECLAAGVCSQPWLPFQRLKNKVETSVIDWNPHYESKILVNQNCVPPCPWWRGFLHFLYNKQQGATKQTIRPTQMRMGTTAPIMIAIIMIALVFLSNCGLLIK